MNEFDTENSFLHHVRELRRRIIISVAIFFIMFFLCYLKSENLLQFITAPLLGEINSPTELIYTELTEGFLVNLNIALFSAFILSIPFMMHQIYLFLSPGLYKNERKIVIYVIISSMILFCVSVFFSYFLVFPNAWKFFLNYQIEAGNLKLRFLPRISDYIKLSLQFILVFSLIFQLPIILILLSMNSFVTAKILEKFRRIFIVLSFIISAILTPPDIFSQIALAIPIILLYEISILIIKKIELRNIKNV